MRKLFIVFLLLVPTLVLAQEKCCVLGPGKCMPLTAVTDEEACQKIKGNIVSEPCRQVAECSKSRGGKCCIVKEFQQCFGVYTPAAAERCKGQLIDCQCSPQCKPSCESQ